MYYREGGKRRSRCLLHLNFMTTIILQPATIPTKPTNAPEALILLILLCDNIEYAWLKKWRSKHIEQNNNIKPRSFQFVTFKSTTRYTPAYAWVREWVCARACDRQGRSFTWRDAGCITSSLPRWWTHARSHFENFQLRSYLDKRHCKRREQL